MKKTNLKKKIVRRKKIDCRNCKHFQVCAYHRHYSYNLMDIAQSIGVSRISNDINSRNWSFGMLARYCEYYDKDCYSKEQEARINEKD